MSTYIFDDIELPSGTLKMKFRNNNGTTNTVYVQGKHLLTIASLRETVEENGIGGVPRIADMDLELYDRNGVFHDYILNRTSVTECYANISLVVSDTEYSVIYGLVELSTVSYTHSYENVDGVNCSSVKFTVLDLQSSLASVSMSDIRGVLDGLHVPANYQSTDGRFVRLVDVFQTVFNSLFTGYVPTVTYNALQSYAKADGSLQRGLNEIYLLFKLSGGSYAATWDSTSGYSYMRHPNAEAFLKLLCQQFLVYPLYSYDPATDSFSVTLQHRNGGRAYRQGGDGYLFNVHELLEASEQTFFGYDAVRVYHVDSNIQNTVIYPTNMSNETFDMQVSKYDFQSFIALLNPAGSTAYACYLPFCYDHAGTMHQATELIINNVQSYPVAYNSFLNDYFVQYWGNKPMLVRRYRGTFVGQVRLLDRLILDSGEFPFFEIERDLVKNETKFKCVEY